VEDRPGLLIAAAGPCQIALPAAADPQVAESNGPQLLVADLAAEVEDLRERPLGAFQVAAAEQDAADTVERLGGRGEVAGFGVLIRKNSAPFTLSR